MAGDWIKMHRKLLDNPIMGHPGMCQLWIYCLMKANWKRGKCYIRGTLKEVDVLRGSFITSGNSLHTALYAEANPKEVKIPSERTLWRWVHALAEAGCLAVTPVSSRCSMITICNYSTYQDDKEPDCHADVKPVSSRCQGDVKPVSTIEEREERKKERREENTLPKPLIEKRPETAPERIDPETAFTRFWEAYPQKANQKAARLEFDRLPLTADLFAEIMAGLDRWKSTDDWKRDGGRFIPHPASFIRGERWKDQPIANKPAEFDPDAIAREILEMGKKGKS